MKWQPIETAPKDGTAIRYQRRCDGKVLFEGDAVYGVLSGEAPARRGVGVDPLGRLSSADYEREASERAAFCAKEHWLTLDRQRLVPVPTHWMPYPSPRRKPLDQRTAESAKSFSIPK